MAAPRPRRAGDPLVGIDRLLVDADNLLGAMARGSDPMPPAAAIGRLRGAIPPDVRIELVFDGPPRGGPGGRIASGVTVRYAGTRSADALLRSMLDAAGPLAPGFEPTTLVVTDDAELRRTLEARGAATARTGWLIGRLGRTTLSAPSVGNKRAAVDTAQDGDRPGWSPGRGATSKRGNPRRSSKRTRRPER
jgi:hypothetical protein